MLSRVRPTIALVCLLTLSLCRADGATYETKRAVPYRVGSDLAPDHLDDYGRKMCVSDIYYPTDVKEFATIVWFHGGGLTGGSRQIPQRLKDQGHAVVGVGYRLTPQVSAKTCIDDAAAAVAWVVNHIADYGGSPEKVFVSGHSAGGYLTSMIGLDQSYLAAYDTDANDLAGLIPYSGHTITHFTVRKEMGIDGKQPLIDAMAPLYHVRDDCPPVLLITGDRDKEMLGRYEENAYFWRMMQVVGHPNCELFELEGFGHGMTEPAHPLALEFVKRVLKSSTSAGSK